MTCAHPKPFHPAAALLCGFIFCLGTGALTAGLLQPDHPQPPIRTAADQTPVPRAFVQDELTNSSRFWTNHPTSTPAIPRAFVQVATPRSSFYVGVQSYALLSACGLYEASMPESSISRQEVGLYPVPNCSVAPIGH